MVKKQTSKSKPYIDYDYIVIGSGFGGSVSALRLVEKGYRVLVIEQGRRYRPEDFPKTNWNLRKYLWMPKLALYGIQAMTLMKDVFILHGAGVGGGSLVYANTLLTPKDEVFADPAWGGDDWKEKLKPYYSQAKKMLGVTTAVKSGEPEALLQECAEEMGFGDTFHTHDVGVYFGEEEKTVPDPYFDGKGPERTGCNFCGGCMVGCRVGAKNSLDMNYLYLAEQKGLEIIPETQVVDVRPTGDGYEVTTKKVTGFLSPKTKILAGGVVFAGGVMGTVKLLHQCKDRGSLPKISAELGHFVRTNSEAIVFAKSERKEADYSKGIAITSGVYPDEETHIETARYGKGQDSMSGFMTILVGGSDIWPRGILFLADILLHPLKFLRTLNPFRWAERTIVILVMQTVSNYMQFEYKRQWWKLGAKGMTSFGRTEKRVPAYLPVANNLAKRMAGKIDGDPGSMLPEVVFDVPTTAHILGGCIMSDGPEKGVINYEGKIHGYDNLFVVDGSVVPSNLGVNPSLTITALAEYVMDRFPEKI